MTNGKDAAFARPAWKILDDAQDGLTKREYFAAMALQGIVANSEFLRNHKDKNIEELAVRFADDLIEQLNK